MKYAQKNIAVGAVTLALAACGSDSNDDFLSEAVGGRIASCTALTQFAFANTAIDSAATVAAGTLTVAGNNIAEHCLVKGAMHKRTSADGKAWAINFEMRMPTDWNGRFFYQANGGLDGSVVTAVGATGGGPLTNALHKGFAVISSDAGHTGAQTTQFGFDPQARLDYGYQAVGKLTPMAKELVKLAYGKAPDRSYIGGCSNGGRHTMVAAARYSDQFDGFLAGAPGYNLPKAAVAQIWGAQQYAKLMTPGATIVNGTSTLPDLATAFTPAERSLVASKILAKCDALDGATDGMVFDTLQCQSKFSVSADVPTCSGARDGSCLSTDQKAMVANVFAGAKTTAGAAIYNQFWFDPGVAGANWALWKFVNSLALDPLAVGTVFRVPPAFIAAPLTVSIDELAQQIYATNTTYTEAGMTFMTPPDASNISTNLRAHKGRMMVYHGASDPVFSAADTASWYDAMLARDSKAADHARFYVVPGMTHCGAGPAADQFDMLDSLVNWVERGVAPDSVVASVRGAGNPGGANADVPADWPTTRTRALCPYPKVARYTSGPTESAASYSCQ